MLPPEQSGHIGDASNELDAIVRSTETATGEILAAAEHLQEVAWTLREQGYQGAACEIIDQRATDIYTACSFQDITGQRTQKVIQILRYLEDRLNAMMAIWGGEKPEQPVPAFKPRDSLVNGPALPGEGLAQSRVDEMMASGPPPLAIDFEAVSVPPPTPPLAIELEPLPVPPPAPPPPPLALELEPVPVPVAPSPPALPPPLALNAPPLHPPVIEPSTVPISIALRASVAPESPFSPPVRPKPRPPEKPIAKVTPLDARPAVAPPTITDIEALPFEERAALFS
jgi:hypothetical protein